MSGACPVWARRRPCCPLLLQAGTEARGVGGADSPAPLPQGAKAQPGLGRWRMLMVTQAPAGRTAWLPFSFSKSPPSSTFYSKCAAPAQPTSSFSACPTAFPPLDPASHLRPFQSKR